MEEDDTTASVKRDPKGELLPLPSYDESIRRGMSLILDNHILWFKVPVDSIVDEKGPVQVPLVNDWNVQHNGAPFPKPVDRYISYQAFHDNGMIGTFLLYWKFAEDNRELKENVSLAAWNIANSTSVDRTYANLSYSTFEATRAEGFVIRLASCPIKLRKWS